MAKKNETVTETTPEAPKPAKAKPDVKAARAALVDHSSEQLATAIERFVDAKLTG